MSKTGRTLARWGLSLAILGVVAGVLLNREYGKLSDGMKNEVLAVADDMSLSPEWRAELKRLISANHNATFREALDVTADRGRKFDSKGYFDTLFDRIVAQAVVDGNEDLAKSVDRQRAFFSISTTER